MTIPALPHIVGIDTSRAPVRLVVAVSFDEEGTSQFMPIPCDTASFDDLPQFVGYWNDHLRHRDVRIAIPKEDKDPLGVRGWILCQCQPLERYEWMAYRSHLNKDLELRDLDLPEAFQRAYVLALYSAYRLRSAAVARNLWAKLFDAHDLLMDIKHETHRLAAALPEPEDWPPPDVPF